MTNNEPAICDICGELMATRICWRCHAENDECPACEGLGTAPVCSAAPHTKEQMVAWIGRKDKK